MKDSLTFINLVAAERGAMLGRRVLRLVVSPDGSLPREYVAPSQALPVEGTDRRPEAFLAAYNSLRSRAKLEPLALSRPQSDEVQRLFPHLLASRDVELENTLSLAIMAGWKVDGAIQQGGFHTTRGSTDWSLERLVGASLVSPGFRQSILDPAVDVLAIATARGDIVLGDVGARGHLRPVRAP